MNEFEIIQKFFNRAKSNRKDVILGIGDDAALVKTSNDRQLAVTIDTLVEGIHFYKNTPAQSIGHKSLAVSLSDLAAMGAEPAWATLLY